MRYFCTLVRMNQADIWAILATDTEWKGLLENDLVWMWEQLHNSSNLPDPRQGYDRWYDIIRHSPGYWKRLVKMAVSIQYFKGRDFSTSDCAIIRPPTPSRPCCKGMSPCNLQYDHRKRSVLAVLVLLCHALIARARPLTCSRRAASIQHCDISTISLYVRLV